MENMRYGTVVYERKDNKDFIYFVTDEGQTFIIRDTTSFSYNVLPNGLPEVTITIACANDLEIVTGIECS